MYKLLCIQDYKYLTSLAAGKTLSEAICFTDGFLDNRPTCDKTADRRQVNFGKNNSYRHLHQPSPIFHRGSKGAKFCPVFRPHSHSECCYFFGGKKIENLKQQRIVWALICRRPRAARAPNSEIHLPNLVP